MAYREAGGECHADVSLTYLPTAESVPEKLRRWATALFFGSGEQKAGFGGWLRPVAALLVIGLAMAALWLVFKPAPEPKIARQPSETTPAPPPPAPPAQEKPTPSSNPEQIAKAEPPTEPVTRHLLFERRGDGPDEGTRGNQPVIAGKPLAQVRNVFLELKGKNASAFERSFRADWSRSGIRLTGSRDAADAALKISISEDSAGRTTAVVRIVNAEGEVIWPKAARAAGWRYTGKAEAVAKRIVADLKKEQH